MTDYVTQLRTAREYEFLRSALLQGGITEETLDLLISNANNGEQRKDSGISFGFWGQDCKEAQPRTARPLTQLQSTTPYQEMPWRTGGPPASFNLAPGTAPYSNGHLHPAPAHSRGLGFQRRTSYGLSSLLDDNAFDDEDFADDANHLDHDFTALPSTGERRTLYFSGFSDRTTYRDLLSVIKGGKLLSVSLRSERSATVTFLNGAAEFLAWAKRNDIYLHAKRVCLRCELGIIGVY